MFLVSDMSMAGNPLLFVNKEFCNVTGYSKEEVLGQNCRFLQGPETEPASVAVIQHSLRQLEDCQVMITNYCKNGETFSNLLSLRLIADSNAVLRFCVGKQTFSIMRAAVHSQLVKSAQTPALSVLALDAHAGVLFQVPEDSTANRITVAHVSKLLSHLPRVFDVEDALPVGIPQKCFMTGAKLKMLEPMHAFCCCMTRARTHISAHVHCLLWFALSQTGSTPCSSQLRSNICSR
jgi:PAS domain S-box-containing protein